MGGARPCRAAPSAVPAFSHVGRAGRTENHWALLHVRGSRVAQPAHSCCALPHPEHRPRRAPAGRVGGQGGTARKPLSPAPCAPEPRREGARRRGGPARGGGSAGRGGRGGRASEPDSSGRSEGEGAERGGRARENRAPPPCPRGEGRGRARIDGRSWGGISIPGAKLELEGRRRRRAQYRDGGGGQVSVEPAEPESRASRARTRDSCHSQAARPTPTSRPPLSPCAPGPGAPRAPRALRAQRAKLQQLGGGGAGARFSPEERGCGSGSPHLLSRGCTAHCRSLAGICFFLRPHPRRPHAARLPRTAAPCVVPPRPLPFFAIVPDPRPCPHHHPDGLRPPPPVLLRRLTRHRGRSSHTPGRGCSPRWGSRPLAWEGPSLVPPPPSTRVSAFPWGQACAGSWPHRPGRMGVSPVKSRRSPACRLGCGPAGVLPSTQTRNLIRITLTGTSGVTLGQVACRSLSFCI